MTLAQSDWATPGEHGWRWADATYEALFTRALGAPPTGLELSGFYIVDCEEQQALARPCRYQRRIAERGLPEALDVPTGAGKAAAVVLAWLSRRVLHPDPRVRAVTPRRLVLAFPIRVLVEQTRDNIERSLQALNPTDRRTRADGRGVESPGLQRPGPIEVVRARIVATGDTVARVSTPGAIEPQQLPSYPVGAVPMG